MTPWFAFEIVGSIAMLAVLFMTAWLPSVRRWRAEAPLREEIRAHPEPSFRTQVAVKVPVFSGVVLPLRDDLDLAVRGDLIEIRQRAWVSRHFLGQEYCFRARDTSIEVGQSNFRPWIIIRASQSGSGQSGSGRPGSSQLGRGPVWISRRNQLGPIWDALVAAGAHPASAPPQMLPTR